MAKTRVLLVGAGGYGELYVRQLAGHALKADYEWVGVVDPFVEKSRELALIRRENVPVFDTLEDFFARGEADLTVIATPIPLHAPHAIAAMERGSDVLLEKPIAGSSELARRIIDARERTGRRLMLGYQWCYDDAMLRFKTLSDQGAFGRPLRMRSLVLWPRDRAYYSRNNWAGKALVNGSPVYDSVSSNATAHYLFNMLWLAGSGWEGAAPTACEAWTARANDVETFDTAVMRFTLDSGAEVLHVASHALRPDQLQEPMFLYEYENAVAWLGDFGVRRDRITVLKRDGELLDLGESDRQSIRKLENAILATADKTRPFICPAEAALKHTLAMEMAREICPESAKLKDVQEQDGCKWVGGLAEELTNCYREFRMPSF